LKVLLSGAHSLGNDCTLFIEKCNPWYVSKISNTFKTRGVRTFFKKGKFDRVKAHTSNLYQCF